MFCKMIVTQFLFIKNHFDLHLLILYNIFVNDDFFIAKSVRGSRHGILRAYEAMVKRCWLSRVSVEMCNELAWGYSFSKWFSTHLQDNLLYTKQYKSRLSTHVVFVCTRLEWITSPLQRRTTYHSQSMKIFPIFHIYSQSRNTNL